MEQSAAWGDNRGREMSSIWTTHTILSFSLPDFVSENAFVTIWAKGASKFTTDPIFLTSQCHQGNYSPLNVFSGGAKQEFAHLCRYFYFLEPPLQVSGLVFFNA